MAFLLDCFGGVRLLGVTFALDEFFFFLSWPKGDLSPSSVMNFLNRSLLMVNEPGIVRCSKIASASAGVKNGSLVSSSSCLLLDKESAKMFSLPGMWRISTS